MAHPNDNTTITFMPPREGTRAAPSKQQQAIESRIQSIVRDQLLLKRSQPYMSAKIRIKSPRGLAAERGPAAERSVVVYLLRADTYTAEVVKLTIDDQDRITAQQTDYVDDEDEEVTAAYAGPRERFEFVCGTPVPEIPTAKAAIETIARLAQARGLRTKVLLGNDASVANYRAYLMSGLKGFVNIGHGNTSQIILADGALTATWLQSLSTAPLSPAVVYFNSCQVFNPPLQPSVMKAGARTFIGGKINLLIGPSEEVCKQFWGDVLPESRSMAEALAKAERERYPTPGAHGISGDVGRFGLAATRRHQKLREMAYLDWCGRGRPARDALTDWLRAERRREDIIRRSAYFHWQGRGCPAHDALTDWLWAEAQFDAAAAFEEQRLIAA